MALQLKPHNRKLVLISSSYCRSWWEIRIKLVSWSTLAISRLFNKRRKKPRMVTSALLNDEETTGEHAPILPIATTSLSLSSCNKRRQLQLRQLGKPQYRVLIHKLPLHVGLYCNDVCYNTLCWSGERITSKHYWIDTELLMQQHHPRLMSFSAIVNFVESQ